MSLIITHLIIALLYLCMQRLSSCQVSERNSALTRLEDSRLALIETVTQYQGRALDVVGELNDCFGHENAERLKKDAEPNGEDKRPLNDRNVRKLFFNIPWKWQNVVEITVKLFIVSAGISSMAPLYHMRRHLLKSPSTKAASMFVNCSRKNPLDVLCGRG